MSTENVVSHNVASSQMPTPTPWFKQVWPVGFRVCYVAGFFDVSSDGYLMGYEF